jgi:hypothetical protein
VIAVCGWCGEPIEPLSAHPELAQAERVVARWQHVGPFLAFDVDPHDAEPSGALVDLPSGHGLR